MQFIMHIMNRDRTMFKCACYKDMRQVCIYYTHTHQVKEVYVKENDSIGEDEVILEFYPEEQN